MKNFYITTPIYYPSARLHLGHAYTTLAGDVLKRYKEQDGFDVFYLTGTDEHGEKIAKKAEEANITPQQFVDNFASQIKDLWKLLDIEYTDFIRTTDKNHETQVQYIFTKLLENGDIYKGEYSGKYCVSCESYFTETQLNEGKCPDCGGDVKIVTEESYFFKTSKYVDRLLEHYDNNPDFIQPVSRKNELVNSFIKPGLEDLAISRTSFTWGIPIPGDEDKVLYVWLDALSNYITALDYQNNSEKFQKFWPANVHLMGKEIIRFHAIYWPMILMALDLPLPEQIFAHGWLLMDESKMSKSKGNVIYSEFLVENYGVDPLRYYLLREIPFGYDGYFSAENFIKRTNNDIVNDLGNLVNRTIAMINKYFDGSVSYDESIVKELLNERHISFDEVYNEYRKHMESLHFSKALEVLWKYISATNKFIDLSQPWVLIKEEEKHKELNSVLYVLVDSIKKINIMVAPFLPNYAVKISKQINTNDTFSFEDINTKPEKYAVVSKPEMLLARLEEEVEVSKIREEIFGKVVEEVIEEEETIEFDEFKKSKILVGEVKDVILHPNANKLLVLTIQSNSKEKQIVSGLADHYKPEELIGKKVVFVDNLKPVKLRGVDSQGMILTVDTEDGGVEVLEVNDYIKAGSEVQ